MSLHKHCLVLQKTGSTLFTICEVFLNGWSPIESREAWRRRTWLGEFKRNLRDGILVAFRLLALRLHLGLCFHRLNRRSNLLLNFLGLRLWSVNAGVRASIKAAQAVVWAIWE